MKRSGMLRVAVAMSGGVDSSVTAALLKEQGYEVFGITMQVLDDSRRQHIDDAAAVAKHLGIPHHVVDLVEPFREGVKDYFAEEYRAGRTPNPCARCNPLIKFGFLLDKAVELGADFLATGHYARVERLPGGLCRLLKGVDSRKDQSYFLFALNQAQLARVMFPLGELTKPAVRQLAAEHALPVKDKGESQEICFIPDDDYIRYLEAVGVSCPAGAIVTATGDTVGRHAGIHRFTVGQRRGLGIAWSEPLYVLGVDPAENKVLVGTEPELYCDGLSASRFNWLCAPATFPLSATCKIRYRHKPVECVVRDTGGGVIEVDFAAPQKSVTPGQAVVLYDGETVLGGGWIEGAVKSEK